jgi:hypothetical protein
VIPLGPFYYVFAALHRRRGQCREPDRRAGRAGDHAGGDRGGAHSRSSPIWRAAPTFRAYLGIPHVPRAGELAILCAGIMGACLAFLWFNAPPAAVFMGDTGSLALGGALGAIAVAAHHEIVLAIVGGLFVARNAVGDHPGRSGSSARANGCSAWPRSTTISNSSAGRNRPWSRASGSSRSSCDDRPVDAEAEVITQR